MEKNIREKLTRIALKTVELMPSATSYSPFSLGRVKLCSLPDPNILKIKKLWFNLSIKAQTKMLTFLKVWTHQIILNENVKNK